MRNLRSALALTLALGLAFPGSSDIVSAAEPVLADYTAYPIFTVNPVKPNIMIMLDNSGSMNSNAYGSDSWLITDQPYRGATYQTLSYKVSYNEDDAEEQLSSGAVGISNGSNDLDFGRYTAGAGNTSQTVIGIRFRDIELPRGAKITEASLDFTIQREPNGIGNPPPINDEASDISLEIVGENSGDADAFANTTKNISSRPETAATVQWGTLTTPSIDPWTPVNEIRSTPDISTILQEIVNRDDWKEGNAIAFKIRYEIDSDYAKRDVYSFEGSSGNAPVLHLQYEIDDEVGHRYYGYFNPEWFYHDGSSKFTHAFKKVKYSYTGASTIYPLYSNGSATSTEGCWQVIYPSNFSSPGNENTWNKACLANSDIVTEELWDGNWMNWASMRRIDIARKVMMGGLASSRQGNGNQVNYGESSSDSFRRDFDSSSAAAVTPFHDPTGSIRYGFHQGYIYIDQDGDNDPFDNGSERRTLAIDKQILFDDRDFNNDDGNLAGVMQKFWDQAYWGNAFFHTGTGTNREGGYIANRVGGNDNDLITSLQNKTPSTWTPLSEMYYVISQYFKQEKPQSGLGYSNSAIGAINNTNDPYYQEKEFVDCAKSFTIILTDGASTKDGQIPSGLKDFDGDGDSTSCNEYNSSGCDYSSGGSDYLDDVALYARTTDLRSDLDGEQNIILYNVYAFGNNDNARKLLMDASRNGGFDDKNGNNIPDGTYSSPEAERKEWDQNGDGVPDTYFEAQDGYKLETELAKAINDILDRASSGTAVSVLATSSEGEGTLTQAYFRPVLNTTANEEIKWAGFLQSLWVDVKGNMREDTNANQALDLTTDQIIKFVTGGDGNTMINKFAVDTIKCFSRTISQTDEEACLGVTYAGQTPLPYTPTGANYYFDYDIYPEISYECVSTVAGVEDAVACTGVVSGSIGSYNNGNCECTATPTPVATVFMEEITPVWEAGKTLAKIADVDDAATGRKIFTSIDDTTGTSLFGGTEFSLTNAGLLQPYFGIKDADAWAYLGKYHDNVDDSLDITQEDRADNLINFIRGIDTGFSGENEIRSRSIILDGNPAIWRLGDIVNSTPVTVSKPLDNYGIIYSDESYQTYQDKYADRETVVYVGANDGMLHAFTSWKYDKDAQEFKNLGATDTTQIGSELWAFIPQALLPHLKWLPSENYTHVFYVDLKPKVVDAKIFTAESQCSSGVDTPGCIHPNGWGSVLVGGLRLGGKPIDVTDNFDYDSTTTDTTRTFSSSFFAIDITDPRNPNLLWEQSFNDLAFTTSRPSVIKIGENWSMVLGSGPDDYDGESSQTGKVYIVDLKTGTPYMNGLNEWMFELTEPKAFLGGAVSLDYGLNYNVDAIYLGHTYDSNTIATKDPDWDGSVYRVGIPWSCSGTTANCTNLPYGTIGSWDTDLSSPGPECVCEYDSDPTNWTLGKLFHSDRPITAEGSISSDFKSSVWVYFGTGRYLSQQDKATTDQNYFYGIKDPFFNFRHSTVGNDALYHYPTGVSGTNNYYHDNTKNLTLERDNLFDANLYDLIFPWGSYEAPLGDCSSLQTGQVSNDGDIYGDGSCIAWYDWPDYECQPTTGSPTAAETSDCSAISSPSIGTNYGPAGTECQCSAYQEPLWGCIPKVTGGCDNVPEGVVADNSSYTSMYWRQKDLNPPNGCDGIGFGTIQSSTECSSETVTPPTWNTYERPAGDCNAAGLEVGMEGDLLGDGGSCQAGYWTCTDVAAGGCDTVDYTITTGFLGSSGDGDIFGDGSCICKFTEDPVAQAINTSSNTSLTFRELTREARNYEGWSRVMPDPGERNINKPAIIGGLTLFPSYVPNDEICAFGGDGYLYATYFETGTPYEKIVFPPPYDTTTTTGTPTIFVPDRIPTGKGVTSTPAIHIGQPDDGENTVNVMVEQSTGVIKDIEIEPAFNVRSGMRYWQQK